jgi:hypothetical protein
MKDSKQQALEVMTNYENSMIVHNYFSDDMMGDEYSQQLSEYAEIMKNEDPTNSKWISFKHYLDRGEITWLDSDFSYKVYLQESINCDVINSLAESLYFEYMDLDISEWEEEYQEKMMLDIIWKMHMYESNDAKKALTILNMNFLRSNTIFSRINVKDVESFVDGLDNFDESQVRLWLKLK